MGNFAFGFGPFPEVALQSLQQPPDGPHFAPKQACFSGPLGDLEGPTTAGPPEQPLGSREGSLKIQGREASVHLGA